MGKKSKKKKSSHQKYIKANMLMEYKMMAWSGHKDYTMIADDRHICGNCEHMGASDMDCPSMHYRCRISGKANQLDHECDVEDEETVRSDYGKINI